ncbi:MAG TPA: 2-C-methyl-D-erythritol 4-phosphate cytidylyltransferase [Candidatus Dormibacteraeota bacterium]|jgi:2-C-methyl-D-erythritol 4-phosphate cytidylyltransferase
MGLDKIWLDAGGIPLLGRTLAAVAAPGIFDSVVVVVPEVAWRRVRDLAAAVGIDDLRLVEGGGRRQDSVRAGLEVAGDAPLICVHDAVRPLCPMALFFAVVDAARRHGAATAAIPVVDSVKRVRRDGELAVVAATLDRAELVAVQTPQAFDAALLRRAHAVALRDGVVADDDCALVEHLGEVVAVVEGDPRNLKVTRPADLAVLRAALLGEDG